VNQWVGTLHKIISNELRQMSCIFEGILFPAIYDNYQLQLPDLSPYPALEIKQLNPIASIVYRSSPRNDNLTFSPQMEYIASHLSITYSQALLIHYDDRVGYRASVVFEEGVPIRSFGEADEIWVQLDEHGSPLIDGKKFSITEIQHDQENEYETRINAIALGLNQTKFSNWRELYNFIACGD
jgi:hypothetical protein